MLCNRYGLPIVEFKIVRRFATANPSGGGQGENPIHFLEPRVDHRRSRIDMSQSKFPSAAINAAT